MEFFAQSNRTYTVEFKESVATGVWQTLTNVMVSTNSRVQLVSDPYPVSKGRIYRLATPVSVSRPARLPPSLRVLNRYVPCWARL